MVGLIRSVFSFICLISYGFGVENQTAKHTQLAIEADWNALMENTPFSLNILITHLQNAYIDTKSFEMKGSSITPEFVSTTPLPHSSFMLSKYVLNYSGLPKGLQTLPPISVVIDGKRYSSAAPAVSIKGSQVTDSTAAFLKLEPLFKGQLPLYPGQEALVGYRYTFNTSVDLVEEILPLLEATGFKKLGEIQIDNGEKNGLSVREITQKIRAIEPGVFRFATSEIKGYAYNLDTNGKKTYAPTPVQASIEGIDLTVAPFPSQGKPTSFNGAIGTFMFNTQLLSASRVSLGDSILLQMEVSGHGEFNTVRLPILCCQPGFSGFFNLSDLPPSVETKSASKTFQVRLFVENTQTSQVPSIEFAFFDPKTKVYGTSKSAAIPLEVATEPLTLKSPTIPPRPLIHPPSAFAVPWTIAFSQNLFVISLFGIGGLIILLFYKHDFRTQSIPKSISLYQKTLHTNKDPGLYYAYLEQALIQALKEAHYSQTQRKLIQQALITVIEIRYSTHKFIEPEVFQKSIEGIFV